MKKRAPKNEATKNIGKAVRLVRLEKGLKQEEMAEQLGETQSALSYIENGIYAPSAEFIYKFAKTYNVSADYLFGLTKDISGRKISPDDISMPIAADREGTNAAVKNQEKLMWQSLRLVFDMISKCKSDELIGEASLYMILSVYRVFRAVYGANPKNRQELFKIDESFCDLLASGGLNGVMARLLQLLDKDEDYVKELRFISDKLVREDHEAYVCMMSVIEKSEIFLTSGKAFQEVKRTKPKA